jgi:hypothetical protein
MHQLCILFIILSFLTIPSSLQLVDDLLSVKVGTVVHLCRLKQPVVIWSKTADVLRASLYYTAPLSHVQFPPQRAMVRHVNGYHHQEKSLSQMKNVHVCLCLATFCTPIMLYQLLCPMIVIRASTVPVGDFLDCRGCIEPELGYHPHSAKLCHSLLQVQRVIGDGHISCMTGNQ